MEYQNIDKEIYHRQEIKRLIRPQYWALISIALGIIGVVLFMFFPDATINLVLMVWGGFALLTMLCYILFGDSRAPYHKPSKHLLTREYFYYPNSVLDQLTDALKNKDEKKLATVKRGVTPQLVLVRYSDVKDEVIYSQIKQVKGHSETPISDIYTNQK